MKLTTEWLSSMSDQLFMHLALKVHKDQDSPTKSLGWGTQKKCHGCNFCFRGIKGDTKPAGNWRGSIGVYIMHCLQCHWANLIAAFYASVNESEKEESGGEKKKGLSLLLSLLFVCSYLSVLLLRELQNDTVAQNWFCSWILPLLRNSFSMKENATISSTKN